MRRHRRPVNNHTLRRRPRRHQTARARNSPRQSGGQPWNASAHALGTPSTMTQHCRPWCDRPGQGDGQSQLRAGTSLADPWAYLNRSLSGVLRGCWWLAATGTLQPQTVHRPRRSDDRCR